MWLGLNLTEWVIIATIVLLLAYDVIVFKIHQPTESAVLRNWGWKYNSLPLCAGILCGHWWGSRISVDYTAWGNALPVIVGYILWDFMTIKFMPNRILAWYRWPLFHVLIGIPVGMFFWGQRHAGSFF